MTHVLTLGRNLKNDRHLLVLFSTRYVACCCGVVSNSCPSVMFVLSAFLLGSAGLLDSLIKYSIPVCICVLWIEHQIYYTILPRCMCRTVCGYHVNEFDIFLSHPPPSSHNLSVVNRYNRGCPCPYCDCTQACIRVHQYKSNRCTPVTILG